jgi:hypothetical protein
MGPSVGLQFSFKICYKGSKARYHKRTFRNRHSGGANASQLSWTSFYRNTLFRWLQLAMGVVCMAMIANLQYGWILFVDPIDAKYHWGRAAIQLAFTLFVVTETWLVPIEAWFVDKYGPSIVIAFGGVMIAIAWILNSYADTLVLLYLAAIIAGIGAGAVYGTCVGNALKWFPDRRGLAAGATAAGFGAGAAITVVPIANMIAASGYQAACLKFDSLIGLELTAAFELRGDEHRRAGPLAIFGLTAPTVVDKADPEVGNPNVVGILFREQNVGRLDIAVDDPMGVRLRKADGDLPNHRDCPSHVALETLRVLQAAAFGDRHDEILTVLLGNGRIESRIVDERHDVRVLERPDGLDFVPESLDPLRILQAFQREKARSYTRGILHAKDGRLTALVDIFDDFPRSVFFLRHTRQFASDRSHPAI